MFRSFLRPSSQRARADSEQHEEWAKPHRSGKQQDGPDGKSRTCHASGKTRKETDQDRHCPDAHPYGPFNTARIAGHGYISLLNRSDIRMHSTQIS